MTKNISLIIEARSTSRRLPNKHFLKANNKMMIEHQIERLKILKKVNIIIATTKNKSDDKFEKISKKLKINIFRGSEKNVLLRVISAAKFFNENIICRVTGDSPLIDAKIVKKCIKYFLNNKKIDYLESDKNLPVGTGCSVSKLSCLIKSYNLNKSKKNLEHVTWFIKNNPKKFNIKFLKFPSYLHGKEISFTLDTKDDFKKIKNIFAKFKNKKKINCENVVKFLSF